MEMTVTIDLTDGDGRGAVLVNDVPVAKAMGDQTWVSSMIADGIVKTLQQLGYDVKLVHKD